MREKLFMRRFVFTWHLPAEDEVRKEISKRFHRLMALPVCIAVLATCGQSTRENCTYFVNSNYPQSYDGTGSCQLTIHKAHQDICQFRLDFDQFNIAGPETIHNVCNNDQFIVSGGSPVPAICGMNNGNHSKDRAARWRCRLPAWFAYSEDFWFQCTSMPDTERPIRSP